MVPWVFTLCWADVVGFAARNINGLVVFHGCGGMMSFVWNY